jgi:hypothetical protein
MSVRVDPTPNPNAMKFSVGSPVGGPKTVSADAPDGDEMTDALVGVAGVTSIFLTADFVTVTKSPEAAWDAITPEVTSILERHFGT